MSVAMTSFVLFAASQVGSPGPANMALLTTGAQVGLRAALPFVAGVVLGKQAIIWPIGFGLMDLATRAPGVFLALKYLSAAYIIWLAWRVARMRLAPSSEALVAPGFLAGLVVHPLNPKAWAMIVAAFVTFVPPGLDTMAATSVVAAVFFLCQLVLHPVWTLAGDGIARHLAGTPAEPYLMVSLAGLTVASVLFVLFGGGA